MSKKANNSRRKLETLVESDNVRWDGEGRKPRRKSSNLRSFLSLSPYEIRLSKTFVRQNHLQKFEYARLGFERGKKTVLVWLRLNEKDRRPGEQGSLRKLRDRSGGKVLRCQAWVHKNLLGDPEYLGKYEAFKVINLLVPNRPLCV